MSFRYVRDEAGISLCMASTVTRRSSTFSAALGMVATGLALGWEKSDGHGTEQITLAERESQMICGSVTF